MGLCLYIYQSIVGNTAVKLKHLFIRKLMLLLFVLLHEYTYFFNSKPSNASSLKSKKNYEFWHFIFGSWPCGNSLWGHSQPLSSMITLFITFLIFLNQSYERKAKATHSKLNLKMTSKKSEFFLIITKHLSNSLGSTNMLMSKESQKQIND